MSINIDLNEVSHSVGIDLLSRNLNWLLKDRGLDSAALHAKTNIASTTINNLRKGLGNPTYSTLVTLSQFFNITLSQLTETDITSKEKIINSYDVPLLNFNELNDFLINNKKFRNSIKIEIDYSTDGCYAIKVNNNAMVPDFDKGVIFVIHPFILPQDGDIVLVQFSSHSPCFRKIFVEGNSFFFKSVSDLTNKGIIKNSDYKILGVVITAIQNYRS